MKALLITVILVTSIFTFAVEPVIEPAAAGNSSDVVGTIQEPSQQTEKKIKKALAHKSKSADKKHHGKHAPAKTEAAPETK